MTTEKFLSFWSQHNTAIIEGLIALIILLALFLAYRSFFGKKSEGAGDHASATSGNIDAGQLEKTLQKILEHQSLGAKLSANSEDLSVSMDIDHGLLAPGEAAASGGEASSAEVAQLRASLSESTKKMEILKTQLAQAQEQVTTAKSEAAASASGAAAAGGASSAAGMSLDERNELDSKVKDLEARLAEYEIISEDIADLSRYREENDDLRRQLEALKSTPAPAPAAPVAAEPAPIPSPVPAPEPEAPAAEPKLAVVPNVEPKPSMDIVVAPEEKQTAENNLIDDDLMKEFAAAVQGQKNLDKAADKAGDGNVKPTANPDDTDKLMDQFEDFVGNKKS